MSKDNAADGQQRRDGGRYAHGFPAWWTGHVKVPNEILFDVTLSANAVRAWALVFNLATRAEALAGKEQSGQEPVDPERGEAAAMIGLTEKLFAAAFKDLVSAGYGEVVRTGRHNLYRVLPPAYQIGENSRSDRRKSTEPRAGASKEVGLDVRLDRTSVANAPDVPRKPRKRNLIFDALAEACGCNPELERGRIVQAMGKLRKTSDYERVEAQVGRDEADRLLAEAIYKKARRYRRVYPPDITLTPQALVNNWRRVDEMPLRAPTPDEIASGDYRDWDDA